MAASRGVCYTEKQSADRNAAWLKRGKKSYFGYRSYLVVDAQDGYVRGVRTVPANQSEMTHFEAAINGAHIEANRVYADKGSASSTNRQDQRKHKIKSAIIHPAYKNKPLSGRQKLANKLINKNAISANNVSAQPIAYSEWYALVQKVIARHSRRRLPCHTLAVANTHPRMILRKLRLLLALFAWCNCIGHQ